MLRREALLVKSCILAAVSEGAAQQGRRRLGPWVLALVLLTLMGALRVWQLDLDPPEVVVPGYRGQAHFRDEPAKAHEARNQAKFGSWRLSEADEYGFWRIQSPAWVYGECLWFRVFGVGVLQARAFVVVHALVTLALLFWLALIRRGPVAAIAATGLLGLNWAYLVYSRLALMEGALLAWLLVASVALSQMDRRPERAPAWSALAVFGLLVACLVKQTGLLLVPAFCVALPWLGWRAARATSRAVDPSWIELLRRPQLWSALLGVLVTGVVLAVFLLNPEYQERLAFNAEHFTGAQKKSVTVLGRASKLLARGLFSNRIRLMFMVFAPVMLWLATLELARVGGGVVQRWRARRRERKGETVAPTPVDEAGLRGSIDAMDLWMLAWLGLGLAANLASPHRAIRFQLVMLPPAAYLAAGMVARAWAHEWPRVWLGHGVRAGLVVLGLLGAGTTGARYGLWLSEGESSAADMGGELEALIGDRHAVVVGEFAAQAVFETDYWHFYVRPRQFNTSPEVIHALDITHLVLEERDFVERQLKKSTPELLTGRRRLGTIHFRGRDLEVWELLTEVEREQRALDQERSRQEAADERRRDAEQARRKRAMQRREAAQKAGGKADGKSAQPGELGPLNPRAKPRSSAEPIQ